jgi:hypothetical protein
MTRSLVAGLVVLASALAAAARASAQTPSCPRLDVAASAETSARWPDLASRVQEAFVGRDDVDQCARVALALARGTITVRVALRDGRSAQRSVLQPDDVVPTLEALLLVPQAPPPAPSEPEAAPQPSAPAPENPPLKRATRPAPHDAAANPDVSISDRGASARAPEHSQNRLRIEVSLLTGARIGDGQTSAGAGLSTFVDLSGWLVGLEARQDRYWKQASALDDASGQDAGVLELAALGGRRFEFGVFALDVTAGAAAALQGTHTFATRSPEGVTSSKSSTSTAPRLLASARLSISPRSTLHPFVGVDGELGPKRAAGADLPAAPQLPVWTVGAELGLTLGAP